MGQNNSLLGTNLANSSELGAFYVKCMGKKSFSNDSLILQAAPLQQGSTLCNGTWNHQYPEDFWRQWPLVRVLYCTMQTNYSFWAFDPIANSPCHNPSALSSSMFSLPALPHLPNSPTSPRFRFVRSELTLGKVQEAYQPKLPPNRATNFVLLLTGLFLLPF